MMNNRKEHFQDCNLSGGHIGFFAVLTTKHLFFSILDIIFGKVSLLNARQMNKAMLQAIEGVYAAVSSGPSGYVHANIKG